MASRWQQAHPQQLDIMCAAWGTVGVVRCCSRGCSQAEAARCCHMQRSQWSNWPEHTQTWLFQAQADQVMARRLLPHMSDWHSCGRVL
jgi:hypothetical protein